MNQRGDILGRYTLDGVNHGYVLAAFRPGCVTPMAAPRIIVTAGGAAVTHSSDFTIVTASKPAVAARCYLFSRAALAHPPQRRCRPAISLQSAGSRRFAGRGQGEWQIGHRAGIGRASWRGGWLPGKLSPARRYGEGTGAIQLGAAGVAGPAVNIMVQ